uniref:Putative transposable element n=1 Tax=Rhipicephalus microplus TaxID=6941 RepID=A0A6G5AEW5_RHIMP
MGRCCVPNCRGNYDNGPKVRLFSFPRDAKRRAEWQRAVRRRDVDVRLLKDPKVSCIERTPSELTRFLVIIPGDSNWCFFWCSGHAQVCERHFKSEHLRTTSTYTDCDGRTIEAPMKLTRLTPDAFPAIFPDCPSYISDSRTPREEPELKRKRTENELLQKAIHESQAAFENEEKQYKVCNLGELISRVNERPNKKFWCTTACETCLIVAHIEPALQAPEMLVSVVVTEDLSVSVYFKCAPLVSDDVCIPDEVRDVRVLDNLLDSVERYCEKEGPSTGGQGGRSA